MRLTRAFRSFAFLRFTGAGRSSRTSVIVAWVFVFAALAFTICATVRLGLKCDCDLAPIYAGSKCLSTTCSPYDPASLEVVMERQGEFLTALDWSRTLPVYPPPTLTLVFPLTLFPYTTALGVMYCLSLGSLFCTLYLIYVRSAWLATVPPMLRGLLFGITLYSPKVRFVLGLGNLVLPSFALLAYCCFDTTESRFASWRRAVLFSIACILKPHFALPMVLFLAVKPHDGWPTVRRAAIIVASFTAIALVWFHMRFGTTAWLGGLAGNLALMRHTTFIAVSHDTVESTLINVEYLIGYWIPQTSLRLCIAAAVLLLLGSALLLGLWRLRRCILSRHTAPPRLLTLAIACVAAFTLLPVYHPSPDGLLLSIAVPWVVLALYQRKTTWAAGTALALVAMTWATWARHLPVAIRGVEGVSMPSSLLGFLTHRSDSICALLLNAVLIGALLYETRLLQRNSQAGQLLSHGDGLVQRGGSGSEKVQERVNNSAAKEKGRARGLSLSMQRHSISVS